MKMVASDLTRGVGIPIVRFELFLRNWAERCPRRPNYQGCCPGEGGIPDVMEPHPRITRAAERIYAEHEPSWIYQTNGRGNFRGGLFPISFVGCELGGIKIDAK